MLDTIMTLIQFALPAGFLGSVITWLLTPRLRKAKNKHSEESIYKMMYDGMRKDILSLQRDYQKMNLRLHTLERKIYEAARCPHFSANCPMFDILQEQSDDDEEEHDSEHNSESGFDGDGEDADSIEGRQSESGPN